MQCTVHVHGVDMESSFILCGNLQFVDLVGYERTDGSEATGYRLKEAHYTNKSL